MISYMPGQPLTFGGFNQSPNDKSVWQKASSQPRNTMNRNKIMNGLQSQPVLGRSISIWEQASIKQSSRGNCNPTICNNNNSQVWMELNSKHQRFPFPPTPQFPYFNGTNSIKTEPSSQTQITNLFVNDKVDYGSKTSNIMKVFKLNPTSTANSSSEVHKEKLKIEVKDEKLIPDSTNIDVCFDRLGLRERRPPLVDQLFNGKQCNSCGIRFPPGPLQTQRYSEHLDLHFKKNRQARQDSQKSLYRQYFLSEKDWAGLENDESFKIYTELTVKSFSSTFVKNAEIGSLADAVNSNVCVIPCKGHEKEKCFHCQEKFRVEWDDDNEEWVIKNARLEKIESGTTKLFHSSCYNDYLEVSDSNLMTFLELEDESDEDADGKPVEQETLINSKNNFPRITNAIVKTESGSEKEKDVTTSNTISNANKDERTNIDIRIKSTCNNNDSSPQQKHEYKIISKSSHFNDNCPNAFMSHYMKNTCTNESLDNFFNDPLCKSDDIKIKPEFKFVITPQISGTNDSFNHISYPSISNNERETKGNRFDNFAFSVKPYLKMEINSALVRPNHSKSPAVGHLDMKFKRDPGNSQPGMFGGRRSQQVPSPAAVKRVSESSPLKLQETAYAKRRRLSAVYSSNSQK